MIETHVKMKTMILLFGVSERRIFQMVEEGLVVTGPRKGTYALKESVKRYINFLKTGGDNEDVKKAQDAAKLKLTNEQARKLERENDIEEKKVIPASDVVDLLQSVSKEAARIFDNIPIQIKRRVPSLKSKDIEWLKLTIAKARNKFADMESS